MFYGPMMTSMHLLSNAAPALNPLFAAYGEQRERAKAWREEMNRQFQGARLQAMMQLDEFEYVGLFAIAAAISILGDNIARIYALTKLNDEYRRRDFGPEVRPGFMFGRVLWVAGNAARHYADEEFHKDTEQALQDLGVQRRDEGAAFEALEIASVRDYDDFMARLQALMDDVDAEAKRLKATG